MLDRLSSMLYASDVTIGPCVMDSAGGLHQIEIKKRVIAGRTGAGAGQGQQEGRQVVRTLWMENVAWVDFRPIRRGSELRAAQPACSPGARRAPVRRLPVRSPYEICRIGAEEFHEAKEIS